MTTTFEQFEQALRDASLRPGIGLIINDDEAAALLSNSAWAKDYFEQWSAMTPVEAYEPVITAPAVVPTPLPEPVPAIPAFVAEPHEPFDLLVATASVDEVVAAEQDEWLSATPAAATKKPRREKTPRAAREPKVKEHRVPKAEKPAKAPKAATTDVIDDEDTQRKSTHVRLAIIIGLVVLIVAGIGAVGWNLLAPTPSVPAAPVTSSAPAVDESAVGTVATEVNRGERCEEAQLGFTAPTAGDEGTLTCGPAGAVFRWL